MPELSSDILRKKVIAERTPVESDHAQVSSDERARSTLIEFPGVTRAVPAWRKQVNQRVREVQEQRAREAAEAAATAQDSERVSCALPSAQLELVPDREQQVMNPIVFKALERLERARRSDFGAAAGAAAAPALSPVADPPAVPESTSDSDELATASRKSKLVVVPTPPPTEQPEPGTRERPVRVISERVEETALSYLENCLSVPVLAADMRGDRASLWRRTFAGILDLFVLTLLSAPIVAGIQLSGASWSNPRVIGILAATAATLMFAYMTITIALTGRTLGMRLLSLRTIDVRTGLIPTGGQSIKRAIGYILSLAILGLGLLFALIDREGRTIHDRLSKTIVVLS